MRYPLNNLILTGAYKETGKVLVLRSDGGVREFLSVGSSRIYGMTTSMGFRFICLHSEHPRVLRLNDKLVVDRVAYLPKKADPHCVYVEGESVKIVSSCEDKIYELDFDLNHIGHDAFGVGGKNQFHVNDVTRIGSLFYVSMFTDKPDGLWDDDIAQGLVKVGGCIDPISMTPVISGLLKPHSPVVFKDDLWVCDSGRGAVWRNSTEVLRQSGAWTRGLCVDGEYIHVGVSYFNREGNAKVVTLTRQGDIVREAEVPLDMMYEIQFI